MTEEEREARREAAMHAHKKRLLVLRQILVGRNYHEALAAMAFARRNTPGYRKDEVTPNFDHQVSIALHATTLPELMFPEEVLATIMTHDLIEDESISVQEVGSVFRDPEFGGRVALATDRLSKVVRGVKRDEEALFMAMSNCPIASIVKPLDRVNNHQGMPGVFGADKIRGYIRETEECILPMVKRAKERFPYQTMAYENLGWTLKAQISLVRGLLPAPTPEAEPLPTLGY